MVIVFQMLGASFVLVQLMMLALWLVYYTRGNATIVDIGWTAGFFLSMAAYFLLGDGSFLKTLVLFIMVAVWSGRLGFHLYRRYVTGVEDPRYAAIRQSWGPDNSDFKFLMLFVFQGVLVVLLSLPFLLVSCCPNPSWSFWEAFGILVWAAGVSGEYFADEQLRSFKENPDNVGKVCRHGLWSLCRHPNYFFEWLVWVGYFFFALPSSMGLLAIISPVAMYYLLRHVSGVPLTEEHLLASKGEQYRQYQQSTSAFFPWIAPRQESSEQGK